MDFNKVYDILEKYGAIPHMRESFVYAHTTDKYPCKEWRFCGDFGFGGKYYSESNRVSYYREDETDKREKLLKSVNYELWLIARDIRS